MSKMSKIKWASELNKIEAIGYLSRPGVISAIEATVPHDGVEKFKEEFNLGLLQYTEEFPYTADKFGVQFRIYLRDTDGCPEFLEKYLDKQYHNRINDTIFIRELVKDWGFKFTRGIQDYEQINKRVEIWVRTKEQKQAFKRGYNAYEDFILLLKEKIECDYLATAQILEAIPESVSNRGRRKKVDSGIQGTAYSKQQLLSLGWIGEKYIYDLLETKNVELLETLNLSSEQFSIEWFNYGFLEDESWEDRSVGNGCDIIITTKDGEHIFIEVKTSKKKSNLFTMTTTELVKMREQGSRYVIVKINDIENLLKEGIVTITVYKEPYKRFFVAEMMKETTFRVK